MIQLEKQLNELYYKIAYKVSDMIPVEWDKVYLLGSVSKKQSGYGATFYFVDSYTKEIVRGYDIPQKYDFPENIWRNLWYELAGIIFELNNCFIENGQESWYEVEFTLDSNGKFDIDFHYDVDMKILGLLDREVIWAYDKFKYKIDNPYYNRILRKYFGEIEK